MSNLVNHIAAALASVLIATTSIATIIHVPIADTGSALAAPARVLA